MEKAHLKKTNVKELKLDYLENLKDEKFKKIVDLFNISEEQLYKNSSLIKESSIDYNNCLKCKNISSCKNKIPGYAYLPKNDHGKLVFTYKECIKKTKEENKNKYKKNIYLVDIPKQIELANIKDIYKDDKNRHDTIKYIINFLTEYKKGNINKGLYLHGNFGCGKTYLVSALFNELAISNVKSAIIYYPEFLRNLKSLMYSGNLLEEKLTKIKKVPLLLLDDIGAETISSWNRDEILGSLLQYRMDEKLPTFFTSNLNINELEKHLSTEKNKIDEVKAKRIIERIKHLTIDIEMLSANLR